MKVSLKSPQHSPALLPQLLTNISLQGRGYCDIVNVGQGCGVEQDRAVNSSIVEEIKSCVLNEVALRIPERKGDKMSWKGEFLCLNMRWKGALGIKNYPGKMPENPFRGLSYMGAPTVRGSQKHQDSSPSHMTKTHSFWALVSCAMLKRGRV